MKPTPVVAVFCLALGAVQAFAEEGEGDRVVVRTPGRVTQAQVSETAVSGSTVRLKSNTDETSIRGRAWHSPVNLHLQPGKVAGHAAGEPAELSLERAGAMLRARGEFAGKRSDIRITPDAIAGRIGHCEYDLISKPGPIFRGFRTCEGNRVQIPTTLEIPPALNSRPDEVRAAVLAVMLYR